MHKLRDSKENLRCASDDLETIMSAVLQADRQISGGRQGYSAEDGTFH